MGTRCALPKDVQHICWISRIKKKNIGALNKSPIKQPTQASQPDFETAFCAMAPSPLPVQAPVFAQLCGSSRWPCLVNSLTQEHRCGRRRFKEKSVHLFCMARGNGLLENNG